MRTVTLPLGALGILLMTAALACSDSDGSPAAGESTGNVGTDPGTTAAATDGNDDAPPGTSSTGPVDPTEDPSDPDSTSIGESTGDAPKFDVGGQSDMPNDGCPGHATDATLTGTVLGPDGLIPVAGALVYITNEEPIGIPQEVYCAECLVLGCLDDEAVTNADGSFTLNAASGAGKYLVVQKGQFMRVTPIDVEPGAGALDDSVTMLPGHNDPDNGLYIPRIAIGYASYDRLEDALAKFGLGDTAISAFEERLVPGSESFELWDNGWDPAEYDFVSQGTFDQLVSDPLRLADYHVIFIPCSGSDFVDALTPENIENIREWTAAGGRWYVADWSNEWLQMVFPAYQDLNGWDGSVGSADNGSYDSLATVLDDGMLEWLNALPAVLKDISPLNDEDHPTLLDLPEVLTVDNWSGIDAVLPVSVPDGKGGMADVSHKVWLEGPGGLPAAVHPLTVTGQFGCGKIQFTSYHAAEYDDYVGLTPQELMLIYTILEIGVCQEPLPPPQG